MRLRARRRLIGLPVAAVVVYLFATNSQVVWLYLISAMTVAMVGLGLAGPILALRNVRLEYRGLTRQGFEAPLSQDRGKVFVGDIVRVQFAYRGELSRLLVGPVVLADGSVWPVETEATNDGHLTLIGRATQRGDLHIKHLCIASSWPIGVVSAAAIQPLAMTLLVHPRYGLPTGVHREGVRAGLQETAQRGQGLEFLGIREYRPGDSERQIHWPSTARRNALMVVETARESQNPSRYEFALRQTASPHAIELGVSIAASLVAGRTASARPFQLTLPGAGTAVCRWAEALAALARANPLGQKSGVSGTGFDARITADVDGVRVETQQGSVRIHPATGIEDALAVLAEIT